ncbi:Uncharacterized protein GNX_3922 [Leptospira interrogans serovar Canicola]|nr:Uncharacterized protein GNX_3922 [Leptospira interrogans serovar Canicola]
MDFAEDIEKISYYVIRNWNDTQSDLVLEKSVGNFTGILLPQYRLLNSGKYSIF